MSKITKEEYLKLLDEVLKAQQVEDLEVNPDFLNNDEPGFKAPIRFNYVDGQGTIKAVNMTRQEIDAAWQNQGNIIVGEFLIKVKSFHVMTEINSPMITYDLYDYEKNDDGKTVSVKIDIFTDVRFGQLGWTAQKKRGMVITSTTSSLPSVYDLIEWLQKLDKLSAFV